MKPKEPQPMPDTDALEEALRRRRQKLGESRLGDAPDPLMGGNENGG
jgi:hypothetical protein